MSDSNVLQLNQQGGGRIDIPLPESGGIEAIDISPFITTHAYDTMSVLTSRPIVTIGMTGSSGNNIMCMNYGDIPLTLPDREITAYNSAIRFNTCITNNSDDINEVINYLQSKLGNLPNGNYKFSLSLYSNGYSYTHNNVVSTSNSITINNGIVTNNIPQITIDNAQSIGTNTAICISSIWEE